MMKRVTGILLAVLLCCAAWLGAAEEKASALEILDFTCETADGEVFTLHEHLGKVVFINFWATWCGPCCAEMPVINDLAAHYAETEDVTILTVNLGDRMDVVQAFLQENGYTLPVACDVNNDAALLYGVYSIPATIIFDKNGDIFSAWTGTLAEIDEACSRLIELIEGLR